MTRRGSAGLALLLAGCSALGLTNGLAPEPGCGDCDELDDFVTPPPCMAWECTDRADPSRGLCELAPRDGDDDGAPDMACAPPGVSGDCDDDDGANHPGGIEVCDGADNDCDGLVDDDVVFAPVAEEVPVDTVDALSWSGGSGDPGRALRRGGEARVLEAAATTVVGDVDAFDTVATAFGAQVDRGTSGVSAPFALVQRTCPSLLAGAWSEGRATLAAGAAREVPTVLDCASAPVRRAALAGRGASLVVAYEHADGVTTRCGDPTAGGTVGVARLRWPDGGAPEALASTVTVGPHLGPGPPAIVDVGDAVDGYGLVLAVTREASIELHRVELVAGATLGDDPTLEVSPAASVPCGGSCGAPSLAAAEVEGARQVGLAWRDGCDTGPLRLARFAVEGTALRALDPEPVELGANGSWLQLAARPAAQPWVVVWIDGMRVLARRVDAAGAPVGEVLEVHRSAGFLESALGVGYGEALTVRGHDLNREAVFTVGTSCAPR
ncbi:MAG: putative metal-binding motif-containing protein [Sandaracinaceae bacterium]